MNRKHKLFLIILGLIGFSIIFLACRYGIGLNVDSVAYISAARNLLAGSGITLYDGSALVVQPLLYPVTLALIALLFQEDPLCIALLLNALLFGLIIYIAGHLFFKHLGNSIFTYVFSV